MSLMQDESHNLHDLKGAPSTCHENKALVVILPNVDLLPFQALLSKGMNDVLDTRKSKTRTWHGSPKHDELGTSFPELRSRERGG